ncbi:reverse transcriptase domain-containing protein [Rubritalea spongiae]|uniref:Reverse transcriptase domain-containing protein n=1 Tax=Rubritalea spongiae TaxID=430797 RepID=A0ABW5E1J1_9BACT
MNLEAPYSATRKRSFPKKGSKGSRTIEIANFSDRVREKLIEIAITPWIERELAPVQFGFRQGRGQQDAIAYLRLLLSGHGPKWVVDADISKFFDKILHSGVLDSLRALNPPKELINYISSWLNQRDKLGKKSGRGLPQGSPLSPVLANLAICKLPQHLSLGKGEQVIIYADDLVCLTKSQDRAERIYLNIDTHLQTLGLTLSKEKSSIRHTMDQVNGHKPGFHFLGVRFWHGLTNKDGTTKPYALAMPSKENVNALKQELKEIVKQTTVCKKYKDSKNLQRPFERMIKKLNAKLRGFGNYYRHTNAKRTFGKIDSYMHDTLLRKAFKVFKGQPRARIVRRYFSGVSRDKQGNPLKKQNGEERKRKWIFQDPLHKGAGHPLTVIKLADIRVGTHTMVKHERSYFDGDWIYWNTRGSGRYRGTPQGINATAIRRQQGKCPLCKKPLIQKETELTQHLGQDGKEQVIHIQCLSHIEPQSGV